MLALVLGAALLAGCGDGGTVEAQNASVDEVAAKVRAAGGDSRFVNPGRWEQTATLVDISIPGAPPEAASAMRSAMGKSQTHTVCLTPERAKNPREEFFAGAGKNCRYENFKWGGGKIDLAMRCTEGQMTQAMDLAGTYSPDAYQMEMTAKADGGEGPVTGMTMRMRVDAKRVGECTGKEDA